MTRLRVYLGAVMNRTLALALCLSASLGATTVACRGGGNGDDTDDSTVTELSPLSSGSLMVTETGTGTVPAPHVIDALAVGRMATADREAEYEKWEGVLVKVENVSVNSEIRPVSGSMPDPT